MLINKQQYTDKININLSNDTMYKKVKKNHLRKIIDKYKDLLKEWKKEECLEKLQYKRLFLDSVNLSRAYSLPKTHKKGELTYRIIISSIRNLLHDFAKFLQKILSKGLEEENYSIKNGLKLKKTVENTIIPEDHVLMSLDVKSPFTSISLDLVIESVKNRWNNTKPHSNIPWETMKEAVELIIKSTYFQFNEKYH